MTELFHKIALRVSEKDFLSFLLACLTLLAGLLALRAAIEGLSLLSRFFRNGSGAHEASSNTFRYSSCGASLLSAAGRS